jgi:protease-4
MRVLTMAALVIALLASVVHADVFTETWLRGASSVAVNDNATAVFVNPAALAAYNENNFWASLATSGDKVSGLALASKKGPLGLGYQRQYVWRECPCNGQAKPSDDGIDTFVLGLGLGDFRKWSLGFDYRWINSQFGSRERTGTWDVGLLVRPARFLSIGAAVRDLSEPSLPAGPPGDRESVVAEGRTTYVAGLALRPGGDRVTLMADAALERGQDVDEAVYTAGIETEIADGFVLRGSVRSFPVDGDRDEEFAAGLWFNARHVGAGASYRTVRHAVDDVIGYELGTSEERMRTLLRTRDGIAEIEVGGSMADVEPGWSLFGRPATSAQTIIRDIRRAAKDPSVAVILLRMKPMERSFLGAPSAIAQEIRDAVVAAKAEHGTRVVAFLEYGGGLGEYYIATAADRIVSYPVAALDGLGNYVNVMRYTGTSEKIGIDWDYMSAGKYKSTFHSIGAGPLTDAQRVEVQSMVDDNYEEILKALIEGRGVTHARALELCDGRIFSAQDAVDEGLIDELGTYEQAKAAARRLAGLEVPDDPEEIATLDVGDWRDKDYEWGEGPRIAVIGAYGDIGTGKGGHDPLRGGQHIGSTTLAEALKRAREDPSVKAVVLRVDSGGGDGIASDIIWQATVKLAEKKPFVVSMADIAGSGGYYIAMAGERIFVDPLTITGSIGVVGMKPVLAPLYEKIDTTHETFKQGEHSDMFSTTRHLTDDEKEMAQDVMDWFYEKFVEKVAEGRHLSVERVQELAQGRVYTGNQAVENGLADALGGLDAAIDYACERVGTDRENATVVYYREGQSLIDRMLMQATTRLGLYRLFDLGDAGAGDLLTLRTLDGLFD